MKLTQLYLKVFDAGTAEELEEIVHGWVRELDDGTLVRGETTLVRVDYATGGAGFTAAIWYSQ